MTRKLLAILGTAVLVLAWAVLLRPGFLGGSTGYVLVAGQSMEPSLKTGDLVVVRRADGYRKGDVIAYRIPKGDLGAGALVIHRIVGGSAATGFRVRGDNNERQDLWRPKPHEIAGRAWFEVAHAGSIFTVVRRPLILAMIAAMFTFMIIGDLTPRRVPA